jgi:hypothetical protein
VRRTNALTLQTQKIETERSMTKTDVLAEMALESELSGERKIDEVLMSVTDR